MVNITARDITVLLLGERGYEVVDTHGEGETLTSPTLQGFTIDLGTERGAGRGNEGGDANSGGAEDAPFDRV